VDTSPANLIIIWFYAQLVYQIFFIYFAVFNVFALNMVLQYKGLGRWRDYLYGELVYIILSFVAKTALAWLVFIESSHRFKNLNFLPFLFVLRLEIRKHLDFEILIEEQHYKYVLKRTKIAAPI
jgi:hypothetical protein